MNPVSAGNRQIREKRVEEPGKSNVARLCHFLEATEMS